MIDKEIQKKLMGEGVKRRVYSSLPRNINGNSKDWSPREGTGKESRWGTYSTIPGPKDVIMVLDLTPTYRRLSDFQQPTTLLFTGTSPEHPLDPRTDSRRRLNDTLVPVPVSVKTWCRKVFVFCFSN